MPDTLLYLTFGASSLPNRPFSAEVISTQCTIPM